MAFAYRFETDFLLNSFWPLKLKKLMISMQHDVIHVLLAGDRTETVMPELTNHKHKDNTAFMSAEVLSVDDQPQIKFILKFCVYKRQGLPQNVISVKTDTYFRLRFLPL